MTKTKYTGLRDTIEKKIGRQILERIDQARDASSGPTMIPPIPVSKFIDKLPEGVLEGQNVIEKEHQESYEAEVKLYRSLEDINNTYFVIHQLEFTHEQYCAFVGEHLCNKKNCKKGPQDHLCHKEAKEVEGESDIVVVGENFVAIFEVKALNLENTTEDELKFHGCCESAIIQRKRIKELIQSICSSVMIFEFTAFPNIFVDEVREGWLKDETLIFCEGLETVTAIIDCCGELSSLMTIATREIHQLWVSLLGLWCIDKEGKWNLNKCSLAMCVQDLDQKLRKSLVTRKSVDEERLKTSTKRGKGKCKTKKYPENPEMVEAPKLFKDHLNISSLTRDQLDVFNSKERFLWVEGPAGSGKTVVMLGKIIDIILNEPLNKRVLVISGGWNDVSALEGHVQLLNKITTCIKVFCDFYVEENGSDDQVLRAEESLSEQLGDHSNRVVILEVGYKHRISDTWYKHITGFDYAFVDDHQAITERLILSDWEEYEGDIVEAGLLPVVEDRANNKTSLWIFCDVVQGWFFIADLIFRVPWHFPQFKYLFTNEKLLNVNLRNTYEISAVLSVIREHFNAIDIPWEDAYSIPQQREGHFLRGTKPVIYLLHDDDPVSLKRILEEQLTTLGDIKLIFNRYENDFPEEKIINRFNPGFVYESISSEWPAVIYVHRFNHHEFLTHIEGRHHTYNFSKIYLALSRARVYAVMILYDYKPNVSERTDRLLSQLRTRSDVCKIIEQI